MQVQNYYVTAPVVASLQLPLLWADQIVINN